MAKKTIKKVDSKADSHFHPVLSAKRFLWHLISPNSIPVKLPTFLNNGIFLAKLSTFGDRLEGTVTAATSNLLNKTFEPSQAQVAFQQFSRFADWSFASCWHESEGEPREEMWKSFGGNHTGIAIRSRPELLMNCFLSELVSGPKRIVLIGSVRYVDHFDSSISATIGNYLPTCFSVRASYSHEQETRLLVCLTDTDVQALLPLRYQGAPIVKVVNEPVANAPRVQPVANGGNGLIVPMEAATLIDQIVIGRNATSDTLASVIEEVGKTIPSVQVVRET